MIHNAMSIRYDQGVKMICWLYGLKKKYSGKTIYVWDINRGAVEVFGALAFMKVDIKGFVTMDEEFAGETYMNRPVLFLNQIIQDKDSVVVAADTVSESKFDLISDRIVHLSEALEFNGELKQKRIIVYGIGKGADRMSELLLKNEMDVDLYCVTQNDQKVHRYRGKKVIEAAELNDYRDRAVIISALRTRYIGEILEVLEEFQGCIYLEKVVGMVNALLRNLFQSIDLALKENREIYLYSKRNALSELIEDVFRIYGIRVNGYVYDKTDKEIENIYELASRGVENKLIIINEQIPERLFIARNNIEKAGFSLEERTYTGVQWYTRANKLDYALNRLMYKLYGKEWEVGESIRILVLGNSSSSELFYIENWVSKLYYKLESLGIKISIYNGAHSQNDIFQEYLELLKNGNVLRPNIVISMSGVNDIGFGEYYELIINGVSYKKASSYYNRETSFSTWYRLIKLLKLLVESGMCGGGGAKFFGFLQPMNVAMRHMSLRERSLFKEEGRLIEDNEFMYAASDNDGYINLMNLFEHQEEMYIDATHYSDKGHEMIAQKVYETILPTLQILNKGNNIQFTDERKEA